MRADQAARTLFLWTDQHEALRETTAAPNPSWTDQILREQPFALIRMIRGLRNPGRGIKKRPFVTQSHILILAVR